MLQLLFCTTAQAALLPPYHYMACFADNGLIDPPADKNRPPALFQQLSPVILIDEKTAISFNTLIFT